MDRVQSAVSKAQIADFINTLPEGLNTYIGEIVSSISGGQAQRIAIAKLLYRQPKVVILDEPTAFIDANGKEIFND
ncbi:ATP-binding cassette domain-containing protein [Paenibacillus sp. S33]|uniref:ATP-binding cassette domain-containing protein n=1 Tax=Paenibacillus peoriae TaxID=59893 RepID=UPI00215ABFAA|nr:ATP-binding cassette domain-containing protein [Paenibacillus peoriae]